MATVSDAFPAAETAAAEVSAVRGPSDSAAAVDASTRARERIAVTDRDGKGWSLAGLFRVMWADWRGAWWWTAKPETLAEVTARRRPTPDQVPDGSMPLRIALGVWMYAVAIPATFLLGPAAQSDRLPAVVRVPVAGVVWLCQHPARAGLALLICGPLTYMWIYS